MYNFLLLETRVNYMHWVFDYFNIVLMYPTSWSSLFESNENLV